jgi:hypothetical protein
MGQGQDSGPGMVCFLITWINLEGCDSYMNSWVCTFGCIPNFCSDIEQKRDAVPDDILYQPGKSSRKHG